MGDRRSSFFSRLFSSAAPATRRPTRQTASRTTAPPLANTTIPPSPTTTPADEKSSTRQTTTATTPSTAETQSAGNAHTPSSTTPPAAETRSASQTTTVTPTPTTRPTAETQMDEKATNPPTNTIPTTPTAETQTAGKVTTSSSSSSSSTTALTDETQTQTPSQSNRNTTLAATMPTSSEAQMANQTTTTSTDPTIKSQTSSPTRATIQPRVTSPIRATAKSRSPPQPSSPSHVEPQSRAMPSSSSRLGSVTPLTPQRTSQPRSPSHSAQSSPRQRSSPSTKGVQHTTKVITHPLSFSHEAPNTVSDGEATKSAKSEQDPLEIQSKKVKSDTADDSHNQTAFKTGIKHNEMEVEPSKSSELGAATRSTIIQGPETAEATQKLDSSSIEGKTKPLMESNANPEENKEVKEVIQETKCEANEKRNNKGNQFLTAKSGSRAQTVEEASITNKSEQMHEETQGSLGKKERLPTSVFNGKSSKTSSQPGKSMSVPTRKMSTQTSREQVPLHKEIKDDISTLVNRMAIENSKNSLNDRPVSVITLAGENRGASMHLGSDSSKGEGAVHIHRGYKINPDGSPEETIDEEGIWKGKKSEDAEAAKEDQPTEEYVNNNTQGINNSIVFNSSINERDPGVHMIVTRAQKEPATDEKRPLEMQKAEFIKTPSQKLTYEPTVRRRCLRGLFLESSDSETENPEKPRRHGCRVGCERSKYNKIDVL